MIEFIKNEILNSMGIEVPNHFEHISNKLKGLWQEFRNPIQVRNFNDFLKEAVAKGSSYTDKWIYSYVDYKEAKGVFATIKAVLNGAGLGALFAGNIERSTDVFDELKKERNFYRNLSNSQFALNNLLRSPTRENYQAAKDELQKLANDLGQENFELVQPLLNKEGGFDKFMRFANYESGNFSFKGSEAISLVQKLNELQLDTSDVSPLVDTFNKYQELKNQEINIKELLNDISNEYAKFTQSTNEEIQQLQSVMKEKSEQLSKLKIQDNQLKDKINKGKSNLYAFSTALNSSNGTDNIERLSLEIEECDQIIQNKLKSLEIYSNEESFKNYYLEQQKNVVSQISHTENQEVLLGIDDFYKFGQHLAHINNNDKGLIDLLEKPSKEFMEIKAIMDTV